MEPNEVQPLPPIGEEPTTQGNWVPACLIGCCAVAVVGVLLCAGIGWWAFRNAKRVGTDLVRNVAVDAIKQSELAEADKKVVIAQVDRVAKAYKEGDIDLEDMGRIMEELAESPLFMLALVAGAEQAYIMESDLTDEEKEGAKMTLRRVARGVFEDKISKGDVESLLDHVSTKVGEQRQMKQPDQISTDELRAFLADAKQLADDAEIPEEPYEVNIGAEFKKAVDQALAR